MLYRILEKYTDEDHQLSMEEILQKLYNKGFECEHDSVKRDIKLLREDFGVEIISGRGRMLPTLSETVFYKTPK